MDMALRRRILERKRAEASGKNLGRAKDWYKFSDHAGTRNMIPCTPGEVRNPKGNNQYTAGASYRDKLDEVWLANALENPESVKPKDYDRAMCLQCGMRKCDTHLGFDIYTHAACLGAFKGMTAIQVCALQERRLVLCGDDDARTHMRKTFSPAPKSIALVGDPDAPLLITHVTRRIVDGSGNSDS